MKINQDSVVNNKAILSLTGFIKRQDTLSFLNDFSKNLRAMEKVANENFINLPKPLNEISLNLFNIARNCFYILRVCEIKVLYICDSQLHAIRSSNPISMASNARALLEHVGTLAFLSNEILKFCKEIEDKNAESIIIKKLYSINEKIDRVYYGKGPKSGINSSPHVESDGMCALQLRFPEQYGDFREKYAFLCEYVHPNHGSNVLVSEGLIGKGLLKPEVDFFNSDINRFCEETILMITVLDILALDDFPVACIRIADWAKKCAVSKAKTENIFSNRPSASSGDGRTKASALKFNRARTNIEEMQMTNQFLQNLNPEKRTPHKYLELTIDDGVLYKCWETQQGNIWIAYKHFKNI